MPNRLAKEESPYLKQHAENPVDWYPWSEEAFEKAQTENKPVFLSIGYATCHWCHVMAHESFEDPDIASLMNEAFINIKVDREERPDIDSTYMPVCQMLTGHGGWPLNVILTPDKEPFFAGTYIPKDNRMNRIGLRQLIKGISGFWNNEQGKIKNATEKIKEGILRTQNFKSGDFPDHEALKHANKQFKNRFDPEFGGFGDAPKFPSAHNLLFLLREYHEHGENEILEMVTKTLTEMRLGGIWDHLGGGFHRYSTDREWLLPHFEKMLYDQALMIMAYSEAWKITGNKFFKKTAYETLDYVFRNLSTADGAFYCAEDADTEGEEGLFYTWTAKEIQSLLKEEEYSRFKELFNIEDEGNFFDEASGQKTGRNILYLSNEPDDEDQAFFEKVRETLFNSRDQRTKPLLDDKIITDWSALMTVAVARAAFIFDDDGLRVRAESAFDYLHSHLTKEQSVIHFQKENGTDIPGMADDYAYYIWAALTLYECTFDSFYLNEANEKQQFFNQNFLDADKGGYFSSIEDRDLIYGRQKAIYDGAMPSANSVTMVNLVRLSRLTGNTSYEEIMDQCARLFSSELSKSGSSVSYGLIAIQHALYGTEEGVLFIPKNEINEFQSALRNSYLPFTVWHLIDEENRESIHKLTSYTELLNKTNKAPAYYLCRQFSCEQPVFDKDEILNSLQK